MHMDPFLPQIVAGSLLILAIGLLLKMFKQPSVIAYLISGIVIGPWVLGLATDADSIARLGSFGVILLLFFVGMETDVKKLIGNWKLAIAGTFLQILLSVLATWILGFFLDWPIGRILLIGFIISLSSTAVVIQLLQSSNLMNAKIGQGVLSILLMQDLAVIPMLIILGLFDSSQHQHSASNWQIIKQVIGTGFAGVILFMLARNKVFHLPLSRFFKADPELQLFAAMGICLGFALISAWLELSTALGAFLAGMIIGAAKETQWVHHTLESFKVLFVSVFFVSIGMLLNLAFLKENLVMTFLVTLLALSTNTFINFLVVKWAGFTRAESFHAGLLLSQIGEFSFVLVQVGFQAKIITDQGYQLGMNVIALSLLVSPLWNKALLKWVGPGIDPDINQNLSSLAVTEAISLQQEKEDHHENAVEVGPQNDSHPGASPSSTQA